MRPRSSQAAIAQPVARRSHNPKVVSSILTCRIMHGRLVAHHSHGMPPLTESLALDRTTTRCQLRRAPPAVHGIRPRGGTLPTSPGDAVLAGPACIGPGPAAEHARPARAGAGAHAHAPHAHAAAHTRGATARPQGRQKLGSGAAARPTGAPQTGTAPAPAGVARPTPPRAGAAPRCDANAARSSTAARPQGRRTHHRTGPCSTSGAGAPAANVDPAHSAGPRVPLPAL